MNTKYPSDAEAKELILEIGRRMYAKDMVAANDGNISAKVSEDTIWVTPTGVSKGFMRENQLVKMKLDGTIVSKGELNPSSEIKVHLRVYKENPDVGGVTHAHPPFCTSFSIAGLPLDAATYSEALITLGTIPCAPYAAPGSAALSDSIAPYCKDYNGVLMGNHGALSWGRDLTEAFYRLESMEHYAAILIYTSRLLGVSSAFSEEQIAELTEIRRKLGAK